MGSPDTEPRLYLQPLPLACPGEAGHTGLSLAGTPARFRDVRLILRAGGRRIADFLFPAEKAPQVRRDLPDAVQGAFDTALVNLTEPRGVLKIGTAEIPLSSPRIMGILNVTPDSFSDGGLHENTDEAVIHGRAMAGQGADIVDVGGESTRPGAALVPDDEECGRVLPVIEALAGADIPLSIDTRKAAVMTAAVRAGAGMINDVSALTFDKRAAASAAALGVPVVLMHAQGTPRTMQKNPRYDDVLLDVYDWLQSRIEKVCAAGIERGHLLVDPGIGFGKTMEHNLALLSGFAIFHGLGLPLLLGASRKRFIGELSGEENAQNRLPGSLSAALHAARQGAHILRVHDVAATCQALQVQKSLEISRNLS